MSICIVYASKYGATEKYAKWIQETLRADLYTSNEIKPNILQNYDIIIVGGGLYAGGINASSVIKKNFASIKDKKLILFTVGLASTDKKQIFQPTIDKVFPKEMQNCITFFHFRGNMDYSALSFKDRTMMGMLKKILTSKPESELSADDKELLRTFGGVVDFINKESIEPLIEYVLSLI